MATTSEKLLEAAQLEPADLGEKIVDPDSSEEEQLAQAVAWLDENVLKGAVSEVSVPFLGVTGYSEIDEFVDERFPALSTARKDKLKIQGNALWDFCIRSYGRSEINKSIDSNAAEYDKDSDQDRIQGDGRLKKLLKWAEVLIATNGGTGESAGDGGASDGIPHSQSVRVRKRW